MFTILFRSEIQPQSLKQTTLKYIYLEISLSRIIHSFCDGFPSRQITCKNGIILILIKINKNKTFNVKIN